MGLWFAVPAFPAFAASGGYAPPPPPAPSAPGLGTVVCAENVPASGGSVTATINGASVTFTVMPGTFTAPVTIVCATGVTSTSGLPSAPELIFAVAIDQGGAKLPGPFTNPIGVSVRDSAITAGASVFRWTGTTYVPATGFTVSAGSAMGSFTTDPGFAIAATPVTTSAPPTTAPPTTTPTTTVPSVPSVVPSATTAVTGKPFVGEGAAGAGLIGLGGLGVWRWRRSLRNSARRR